jgi:hypothetical protein
MAFIVNTKSWLKIEGDRVAAIIVLPKFWGVKWNHAKLQKELRGIGLSYSPTEIGLLNDELHLRGLVEDVADLDA